MAPTLPPAQRTASPLLAAPEPEPPEIPADLEPPAPHEPGRPPTGPVEAALEEAARAGTLADYLSLLEVKWDAHLHPRWPAGTPGGLGGKFIRVGQRLSWKGTEYDVAQVLPGGVYAHVASKGDTSKVGYVWIPAKQEAGSGHFVIPGAKRPPAEAVAGAKSAHQMQTGKFTPTIADPYVHADHDDSIPIPADAPPELTPERWKRFGRADQLRYADVMREFGKWSPGKAQGLLDQALAKQEPGIVDFVKSAYSAQYGSSSAFTIGFHQVFGNLIGHAAQKAQLEHARDKYEAAKAAQDAAARAIQWDLYNRVRSPEVAIFHKSGDGPAWWKTNVVSGKVPAFSGLSQTQRYNTGGFGGTAVCTPLAIRNVVMATTSADVYKGHSFQGEQEVSVGDPLRLDKRSLVFGDNELTPAQRTWLTNATTHGADGDVIEMVRRAIEQSEPLPVLPQPVHVSMSGGKGTTWIAPPVEATKGIGKLAYADVDSNGAPAAKPANTLNLKPGDYVEGMQGTRYIILEDKGNPFGVRYYKVTDTDHADWAGPEESYEFEGNGVKPFKKLVGHFDLPSQASATHTGFVPHAWSETAEKKLIGQLPPGTKFKHNGIAYELTQKLAAGQYGVKNLDSGQTGTVNTDAMTPWLVLKEGYTEEGVPAFSPGDYFQRPAAKIGDGEWKPGDVLLAGATGDLAWQVKKPGPGGLQVVGLVGSNQGKENLLEPSVTVRKLEPKPSGWLPPAVGDTLSIDGKKGEVTKLLSGGVVQVNLKPGVVKLKPDDWRLAGLFRASAHHLGEKVKLRDLGAGEKFHGGTGGKVRPYLVLEKGVKQPGTPGSFARVRNLDTGEESLLSQNKSYPRLVPHGVDEPAPGGPTEPVDYGSVFNPEAWKVSEKPSTGNELAVGDKFQTVGGTGYLEVTADKGAAWEVKDLLTGEMKAAVKGGYAVHLLEPSGVVPPTAFDPEAYSVGPAKKLSELKKGDIFQGTKKGKHYLVTKTGAKSGLTALDLDTGKVSSPWSYDKVAPVLEPPQATADMGGIADDAKADYEGIATKLAYLKAGDQFLLHGNVFEVVEPPAGKESNAKVAPVLPGGGLGLPGDVGYYPDLLVTYHHKLPPAPPALEPKDSSDLPTSTAAPFSPKSKTGGGYVFTKAKNAGAGVVLQSKDGTLWKVKVPGPDPIVSGGDQLYKMPGEHNLKVVDAPFDDHTGPVDAAHAVGQGSQLDVMLAAHPLVPNAKPISELNLQVGDALELGGQLWVVKTPMANVGVYSSAVGVSSPDGGWNMLGKDLIPSAVSYVEPASYKAAQKAAVTPLTAYAASKASQDLGDAFEQMSSSAGKAGDAMKGLGDAAKAAAAKLGAPGDNSYADNSVLKVSLDQLQPGTWVKSHAANVPWKVIGPDPNAPDVVLVQTPSGVEHHLGSGVPDLVGPVDGADIPDAGAFVPNEHLYAGDLKPGDEFKGHAGTVWRVTDKGPQGVGFEIVVQAPGMPDSVVGNTGWMDPTFKPAFVKLSGTDAVPKTPAMPADPDDYTEGAKTTIGDLPEGAVFKSVTGKVFQVYAKHGDAPAEVRNLVTGKVTVAATTMPTVQLHPKAAPADFKDIDRQLAQSLKDAQDAGDEDAYMNAENAILQHLGLSGTDEGDSEALDAFLAGVGAQYGIDVEAGAPEPGLGPLDTPTAKLPVGAEFEDSQGDKWVVTATDEYSTSAELIADPEAKKVWTDDPEWYGPDDEDAEVSGEESVRVLSWGPHGPTGDPKVAGGGPLAGAEPGDKVELGGKTYTVSDVPGHPYETSDLVPLSDENGVPSGTVHKGNTQAKLVKAEKGTTHPEALAHVPGPPTGWKSFSPKSKSGGGYTFKDLGQLGPGDQFRGKDGNTYEVKSKTADGYYVRFVLVGGGGAVYRLPAGERVKLA